MQTIGIAAVGTGAMGRYVLDSVLKQNNRLRVTAIFDPDPAAVEKTQALLASPAAVCGSEAEVAGRADVQWLMIGSRNCDHYGNVMAGLRAGKHVFCQKPLAINLEHCVEMKQAWEQSGRLFSIGFTLRYSPHYRKIKELIDAGAVGRIVSLEFNETLNFNHGGHIMSCWRRRREWTGCHMLEKCCHDADLVNWMTGSRLRRVASFGGLDFFTPGNEHHMDRIPASPEGHRAYCAWPTARGGNPFRTDKDIIDNQVAILEYENGVRATFHTNLNAGIPERRMYILGTEGAIRADVIAGTIQLQRIGWDSTVEDISTGTSGGHGGGDEILAKELADSMLNGAPPAVGLIEGMESAIACFAIDQAMDTGQVVDMADWWKQAELT